MRKTAKPAAVESVPTDWHAECDLRRKKLAAALLTADLPVSERAFLAACQRIYRRHSGCTSPFENFFWSLVQSVQHDTWPTPENVARDFDTFKDDFETMDRWARLFVEAYPAPATPEPPAAVETTQPTRKGTTGHPRARKPLKKVARA